MPKTPISVIIISCLLSSLSLSAQTTTDISAMRQVIPVPQAEPPYWEELKTESSNEVEWVATQMFGFYKSFISSQDGQKCSFHLSCSEYAILVVKQRGILEGMLATFDRLTRCNGLSPEWYEIDQQRGVLID
ncbi:MAG: membrane protein insertion efficiency factor YidD, partial [Bacteroidota bacterium]